ncbi:WAT1-related protein At4g08300-like isoform X2 [Ananas comosus]|uniref:WAT1-related protein n=1 Tax=Ananas comosus TaxID=4615 RepID=A0A6P5H158_ANACO|nr:WAT1-related protein At4g08300-like isoform X2 [Ananas comosus]
MTLATSQIRRTCRRYKPHFLMALVQLGYTILYFITEAAFNHGLNPHVFITYRQFVGGLATLPFAYFLERKLRPKFTWALLLEISVLSLLGLEHLDAKSPRGIAKIVGTVVSLAGVTTMTLYKGHAIRNLWGALIHLQGSSTVHKSWLKGSILTVASCITWSIWYIMQAITLKRYSAQLSLTTWMSFVGGAQSAVFTAFVEQKTSAWIIGFDIKFWSIIYSGVVCSGLIIFIQLWCTEEKGPVFVTMFNPLSTIMVALLAYFVFGERLYMGSIMGGVIVIVGLYLVLWGKERDKECREQTEKQPDSTYEKQNRACEVSATNNGEKDEMKEFYAV